MSLIKLPDSMRLSSKPALSIERCARIFIFRLGLAQPAKLDMERDFKKKRISQHPGLGKPAPVSIIKRYWTRKTSGSSPTEPNGNHDLACGAALTPIVTSSHQRIFILG